MFLDDEAKIPIVNHALVTRGIRVFALHPHENSLEEMFVRIMGEGRKLMD